MPVKAYGVARWINKVFLGILFGTGMAVAQPVTIAALGDSLTQGYGLIQEDGFVPQLEGWLAERGHEVVILNAGVSGDTTAGGLARAAWTLTPDVDAMIVALGGNDLLRGILPEASRENLAGILRAAQEAEVEVLLIGLNAPGNYGPEFQRDFNAMYPDLAAQFGTLYIESFLGALETQASDSRLDQSYMQGDGLHPTREGVALIVEAVGPEVEALIARVGQP